MIELVVISGSATERPWLDRAGPAGPPEGFLLGVRVPQTLVRHCFSRPQLVPVVKPASQFFLDSIFWCSPFHFLWAFLAFAPFCNESQNVLYALNFVLLCGFDSRWLAVHKVPPSSTLIWATMTDRNGSIREIRGRSQFHLGSRQDSLDPRKCRIPCSTGTGHPKTCINGHPEIQHHQKHYLWAQQVVWSMIAPHSMNQTKLKVYMPVLKPLFEYRTSLILLNKLRSWLDEAPYLRSNEGYFLFFLQVLQLATYRARFFRYCLQKSWSLTKNFASAHWNFTVRRRSVSLESFRTRISILFWNTEICRYRSIHTMGSRTRNGWKGFECVDSTKSESKFEHQI